jgi:hypothetical protein
MSINTYTENPFDIQASLREWFENMSWEEYNLSPEALDENWGDRTGILHTEETKKLLRENHVGMTGSKQSEYQKKRMSEVHSGKIVSEETRKKMSLAAKLRPANRKGIKLSDEHKRKISEANKKR